MWTLYFIGLLLSIQTLQACFITDCPHSIGKKASLGKRSGANAAVVQFEEGGQQWKYPQVKIHYCYRWTHSESTI